LLIVEQQSFRKLSNKPPEPRLTGLHRPGWAVFFGDVHRLNKDRSVVREFNDLAVALDHPRGAVLPSGPAFHYPSHGQFAAPWLLAQGLSGSTRPHRFSVLKPVALMPEVLMAASFTARFASSGPATINIGPGPCWISRQ
jgi:hypothetical protein